MCHAMLHTMIQFARVYGGRVAAQAENPEVTKVVMGWVIFWLVVGGLLLQNWWMAGLGAGVSALAANMYLTDDRVPPKRLVAATVLIIGFLLVATSHVLVGVEAFPGTPVQTFDCGTTFNASKLGGGQTTYWIDAQSLPDEERRYVTSICGPNLNRQATVMYVALGLAIVGFFVMTAGSKRGSPKPRSG